MLMNTRKIMFQEGFLNLFSIQYSTSQIRNQVHSQKKIMYPKIHYNNFFFNLSTRPTYNLITSKKVNKKGPKSVYTIKKTQLLPNQNVFLLYEGQKQKKSFQWISGLFILVFGLSLFKIYHTQSQYRRDDYIVLFIVTASFIVYQRRILQTLKRMTLSARGDKLFLTTFNILAKGQRTIEAPIQIMTGISRATRFGGIILKGGGKTTTYKQMKFWFSKQYITDQETFQYVAQGKSPKIVDQFQTL